MNSVYIKSAPPSLQTARNGGSLTSSMGARRRGKSPKSILPILAIVLTKALLGIKSCLPCLYLPAKLNYFRKMFENELGARSEKHPVINLIVILLMVGLGFIIVGPIIGFFIALPFYDGGMIQMAEAIQRPMDHPELKVPLYIIQGCATFVGLLVAPAFFLRWERRSLGDFFAGKRTELIPVLLTAVVIIVFMAVNSVFIEWNAELDFP